MALFDRFLARPLLLAPMAGYTDRVFRTLCREQGADLTVTEMVSAKGLQYGSRRTGALLETDPAERPAVVQLFGREPEVIADIIRRIAGRHAGELAAIDLNMGCPARKITGNGEGSALMREPLLAGRIIEAAVKASPIPVTVKCRKGWDEGTVNAVEIARIAEDAGAAAITVHGRTREQMYTGRADWSIIAEVKRAVRIPVIGNGDVTDGESALAMLAETRCDALMIGRGALGNPWIFREVRAALDGTAYAPPTAEERRAAAIRHAELEVNAKGGAGMIEMRKHLACYIRGERDAASLRVRLNKCRNIEELRAILT